MTEKDKLLRLVLRRIQENGYYHHTDVALVDWFVGNTSVKEVGAKYGIHPNALYQHKSRLVRQQEDI